MNHQGIIHLCNAKEVAPSKRLNSKALIYLFYLFVSWFRNSLRGFLGLTGYYHKSFYNYGHISRPITNLLKKKSFLWTDAAQQAFVALKKAMCSTPVLALPNFMKSFVIECDASGTSIGVVLMQEGQPLAFTSQQLSGKHLGQYTYEKEMIAILHAVDTWRP